MSGQRALEDLDRLAHVTLGPRQLEEVAAPDDLRRAVEVVLVDLEGGLQAVAELPFDALRERGEDADALRVEADADARLVMTADVVRLRFAGLVAGFPRLLAQLGLAVAFGAVRVPVVERRLAPVGLERLRVLRQLIVE